MIEFTLKNSFGQHNVYELDKSKYCFLEYFQNLFDCEKLHQLHLKSEDALLNNNLSDVETDLHKVFYKDIKTNPKFKDLYCNLIQDIYSNLYPEEDIFIYQSFPSIRIQYFNNVVIPPHYDSDHLGNHPLGEKNFILPITKMYGTNRMFIESEQGKKDFQGIDLEYGDLLHFNGNTCTHYNEKNTEKDIRVSLDFRIILLKDYKKYMNNENITFTNPRDDRIPVKMTVGGYYQICFKNDLKNICNNWFNVKEKIIQTRPNFDINEANACFEYMKNGDNFVTEFKQTTQLEKMITDFTGSKYCVMTTSGTTALMISFYTLGIGKGDDVIVPNYTMIASINSIRAVGANPIIVDVDSETGTISKEIIEKNITKNTKAVIHVSLNNRTKNLDEIVEYCKQNNLFLVEDAAQSLGCFLNKKHIGTFGNIGCFSLSTPKIISTGQGGFLLTDNEDFYKKINMIKNFGRKEGGSEIYEIFGLNLKFTDIQAVIGIEQMKKLPSRIKRMREIFDLYYKELNEISEYCKMFPPQNEEWIPWFIDIFVEDRDDLAIFLNKHNIQTRITYPEINKTPMYFDNIVLVNSKYISSNGLFLPSHTLLTDQEIKYICEIIKLYCTKK
jgi:perosamine synthetase